MSLMLWLTIFVAFVTVGNFIVFVWWFSFVPARFSRMGNAYLALSVFISIFLLFLSLTSGLNISTAISTFLFFALSHCIQALLLDELMNTPTDDLLGDWCWALSMRIDRILSIGVYRWSS